MLDIKDRKSDRQRGLCVGLYAGQHEHDETVRGPRDRVTS